MLDRRSLILLGVSSFARIGKVPTLPPIAEGFAEVMRQSGAPALAYTVVSATSVLALEAVGRRRIADPDLVTPEDRWHIGSNAEAMTAALYAKLVEQGRARWSATVPELFPDLKAHPVWQAVTIEDLLSHHSGLGDLSVLDEDWLVKASADKRPVRQQRTDFAAARLAKPPPTPRGDYVYAASNYILVGAAIERVVRTDWETAITDRLFAPLLMGSAGFGPPTGPEEPWGHELNGRGLLESVNPKEAADNPAVFGPAGRVHLSLADYARFAQMVLAGGGDYLRPESVARLARPQDGTLTGDALGWRLQPQKAWAEGPVLNHEGSNTLWRARADLAPAKPLAILVVSNAGGEAGAKAVDLMAQRLIAAQAPTEE